MARIIPAGYGDVSLELHNVALSRSSYLTFGIDPTEPLQPTAVATAVVAASTAAGSLMSMIDNQVVMQSVTVRIGQASGEPVVGVDATAHPGSLSISSLPPNCALLVHKVTAAGGRRGRGRFFIPWTTDKESVNEAGILETGSVDSRRNTLATWLTALSTNGVPMVLLHGEGKTALIPPTPVALLQPMTLLATQRRRLGR